MTHKWFPPKCMWNLQVSVLKLKPQLFLIKFSQIINSTLPAQSPFFNTFVEVYPIDYTYKNLIMRRGSVYVSKKEEEFDLLLSLFMALLFSLIKYGVLIVLPLHLGMFVVGIRHRNDCPIDIRIPWYLIFGGKSINETYLSLNEHIYVDNMIFIFRRCWNHFCTSKNFDERRLVLHF